MDRTVVAMFDDVSTAQRALEELLRSGFDRNDISVVRTNEQGGYSSNTTTAADTTAGSGVAAGAGIGAALGGIAGLVVGLGALAIPGIGPIVAAGPLATTLAGAGIGAAAGGIIGALTDVGIPETEAGYYVEGIRRGGTLLTVRASQDKASRAQEILNRFSPIDVTQRAAEWRSSGWTGSASGEQSYQGSQMGSTTGYSSSGMSSGYSSRFEDYDNDFRSDWQTRYGTTGYDYQRYRPAYQYGWQLGDRYQGRSWNDIETNVRTDWERNHPNDAWEDFKDSIRTGWERFKQGASNVGRDVERGFDRTTGDMSRSFDTYDRDFRSDWERSYRSTGYDYERYRPAYQYGYTLANESRYRGRDWNDFESDARRDWEMRHPGERWDDFKDAVRHAWQRAKADVKDALD